jgi:hypothetical protein
VENVPASDKVGELGVAVASEQLYAVGRHGCGGVGWDVEYSASGVVRDCSWLTWWREGWKARRAQNFGGGNGEPHPAVGTAG